MATFSRTQQIEHVIGPRGRFVLRVTSPEVELRAVSGDMARVWVEFELDASSDDEANDAFSGVRFDVRQGEGVLEVGEPKRDASGIGSIARLLGRRGGSADEVSIRAEVPATAEVVYEGVSADLTATGFTGAQEYRTVSGDIVLDRLEGQIAVRGVSGDVSLRADAPVRLELNTVSGDASAFAPRFDELRVVTVSGDVEIEGELADGAQHRVETVSGDLSLGVVGGTTLEVRGLSSEASISMNHRAEGSRDRRRYVIGGGEAHLLFSSMSGDVVARESRRFGGRPTPPTPPTSPTPPAPPTPPARPLPSAEEQLAILRALERGEIDVDAAADRLAGRSSDD